MSGLSALASYAISDEEDAGDKIVDSEDEHREEKEEEEQATNAEPEDSNIKQEDDDDTFKEDSEAEDGEEGDIADDTINVENLSTIRNEGSDGEAAGSSGEEGVDTSNLGSTLAVQAKRRAKRRSSENATALAKKLRTSSIDEVGIPPEPEGHCSVALQDKITRFLERKVKDGEDLNRSIQARKDFRNPSIYEKLILYLGIQEMGTNFPPQDYDPKVWRKAPAYDELARAQREDMAKREKERKTKVEFVTGVVKKPGTSTGQPGSSSGDTGKKSKWDQQGAKSSSSDKTSKPTVISAVGAIKKQKP